MNHTDYTIKVIEKIKKNPEHLILALLHEYSHAISQKRFKTADYTTSEQELIEEGMADIFADIVARSNYEKNGILNMNGEELDLSQTTLLKYSGYKNNNKVVRTMLYPLEETGKDKEAIFNFYFDNKLKFYELTLGTEYIKKLPNDFNKNPNFVDFSWAEIYRCHEDGYKTINSNSVYAINNEKLIEFSEQYNREMAKNEEDEIQNKEKENEDEESIEVTDYYEKYGISPTDRWETIKRKLIDEEKIWGGRYSSTDANRKDILEDIEQRMTEISEAMVLFRPGNEEKRKIYDERLAKQKKRQGINNVSKEKVINMNKNNKIRLTNIAASIKKNPVGLEQLMETQKQMAIQIQERTKNEGAIKFNNENLEELDDIER